jgi:hypothetical protein
MPEVGTNTLDSMPITDLAVHFGRLLDRILDGLISS